MMLNISRDFEEPSNPEFTPVQFKQVILQAVKSLFGIVSVVIICAAKSENRTQLFKASLA